MPCTEKHSIGPVATQLSRRESDQACVFTESMPAPGSVKLCRKAIIAYTFRK